MSKIDFIYFDLGNVIFHFDHEKGLQQVSELTELDPSLVSAAIFETGLDREYESGLIDSSEFHLKFCARTRCSLGEIEFLKAISNIFRPNLEIFPVIVQLRAVNFPIGILSNTCHAHWNYLWNRYTLLRELFGPAVLSFEARSMKPDAEIYLDAISRANVSAGRCFFVDDRKDNVEGALKCGLDAVQYSSVQDLVRILRKRGVAINL